MVFYGGRSIIKSQTGVDHLKNVDGGLYYRDDAFSQQTVDWRVHRIFRADFQGRRLIWVNAASGRKGKDIFARCGLEERLSRVGERRGYGGTYPCRLAFKSAVGCAIALRRRLALKSPTAQPNLRPHNLTLTPAIVRRCANLKIRNLVAWAL